MQIDILKYKGCNLKIYKTSKGYTINNIDFYEDINELKKRCKTLIKKIRGELSY